MWYGCNCQIWKWYRIDDQYWWKIWKITKWENCRALAIHIPEAVAFLSWCRDLLPCVCEWLVMTSSNGHIFHVAGIFVRGIHQPPVNSPHKGQWRGALIFPLIYSWINVWANNRDDLRRHGAHYDVTIMCYLFGQCFIFVNSFSFRWNLFSRQYKYLANTVIAIVYAWLCHHIVMLVSDPLYEQISDPLSPYIVRLLPPRQQQLIPCCMPCYP